MDYSIQIRIHSSLVLVYVLFNFVDNSPNKNLTKLVRMQRVSSFRVQSSLLELIGCPLQIIIESEVNK